MDKNVNKVSNLYGRARRIEFVEKIVYVLVGILAIGLVFYIVANQTEKTDDNVNFAYLRNYMESKGFYCEMIHRVGGRCSLSNANSSLSFIRYDDGFEYIANTKGYTLDIRHKLSDNSIIEFRTTSEALVGYKNKKYSCTYDGSVITNLQMCVDADGEELTSNTYKGVILQAMNDLNNIIDSSGYDKKVLLEQYKWEKK